MEDGETRAAGERFPVCLEKGAGSLPRSPGCVQRWAWVIHRTSNVRVQGHSTRVPSPVRGKQQFPESQGALPGMGTEDPSVEHLGIWAGSLQRMPGLQLTAVDTWLRKAQEPGMAL